uniref:AP2/ERF domain-containing protein n=1 Tax=Picocystis salinarum TaxID=88271 RepID=A0A7S3XCV8_9CHLO
MQVQAAFGGNERDQGWWMEVPRTDGKKGTGWTVVEPKRQGPREKSGRSDRPIEGKKTSDATTVDVNEQIDTSSKRKGLLCQSSNDLKNMGGSKKQKILTRALLDAAQTLDLNSAGTSKPDSPSLPTTPDKTLDTAVELTEGSLLSCSECGMQNGSQKDSKGQAGPATCTSCGAQRDVTCAVEVHRSIFLPREEKTTSLEDSQGKHAKEEEFRKAECRTRRLMSRLKKKRAMVSMGQAQKGDELRKVSTYLGVTGAVNRKGVTWQARITCPKRSGKERSFIHLGMHTKEIDAAKAFDRAAIVLHGPEHAALNFKVEDYSHELDHLTSIDLPTLAAEYRQRPNESSRAAQETQEAQCRAEQGGPPTACQPKVMQGQTPNAMPAAPSMDYGSAAQAWTMGHSLDMHKQAIAQKAAEAGMAMCYVSSIPLPELQTSVAKNGFTPTQLCQLKQQIMQSYSTSQVLLANLQTSYTYLMQMHSAMQVS